MADEIQGQRMSDYTDIDSAQLTSTEKEYYKANARVTTFGKVDGEASTPNSNYNIPLSEIAGEALPPIESGDAHKVLTVNANEDGAHWVDVLPEIQSGDANKVLTVNSTEDGVHWDEGPISYDSADPIAITSYFDGDPKIELQYNNNDFTVDNGGVLELVTPMPEIGDTENRGKFLKVADDSDELIFDNLPSELPEIGTSQHRGEYLKVDDNSDNLVWDTIPTAPTYTAGTGLDITSNTISVTLPVPDPGTDKHRGHVLTVNDSDDSIKWAASNGVPSISSLDSSKTYKLQCDKGVLKWVEDTSSGAAQ